jgi:hypothetical protein
MEDKIKFVRDFIDTNNKYLHSVFLCNHNINSSKDWEGTAVGEVIGSSIENIIIETSIKSYEPLSFARLFTNTNCREHGVPFDWDKEFYLMVIEESESGNREDPYNMHIIIKKLSLLTLEAESVAIIL